MWLCKCGERAEPFVTSLHKTAPAFVHVSWHLSLLSSSATDKELPLFLLSYPAVGTSAKIVKRLSGDLRHAWNSPHLRNLLSASFHVPLFKIVVTGSVPRGLTD